MSELLYCDGCKCTLQMWDEEYEGDDIWVCMRNDGTGEEDYLCENCYAKYLR